MKTLCCGPEEVGRREGLRRYCRGRLPRLQRRQGRRVQADLGRRTKVIAREEGPRRGGGIRQFRSQLAG